MPVGALFCLCLVLIVGFGKSFHSDYCIFAVEGLKELENSGVCLLRKNVLGAAFFCRILLPKVRFWVKNEEKKHFLQKKKSKMF